MRSPARRSAHNVALLCFVALALAQPDGAAFTRSVSSCRWCKISTAGYHSSHTEPPDAVRQFALIEPLAAAQASGGPCPVQQQCAIAQPQPHAAAAELDPPLLIPLEARLRYAAAEGRNDGDMNGQRMSGSITQHAPMIATLAGAQRQIGITGAVGEIGCFKGSFTITIAHTARRGERIFGADIFFSALCKDQPAAARCPPTRRHQNAACCPAENGEMAACCFTPNKTAEEVAAHEGSLLHAFLQNAETFGIARAAWDLYIGPAARTLPAHLPQPARLVSVDGFHSKGQTASDLSWVACNLVPGGIVVVDDFFSKGWADVTTGVYETLRCRPDVQLYPFLVMMHGLGKVYLTNTQEHHRHYYSALASHPFWGTRVRGHSQGQGHHGQGHGAYTMHNTTVLVLPTCARAWGGGADACPSDEIAALDRAWEAAVRAL